MVSNIFSLKEFEVKSNQSFFFDNNIWMFLFCPVGDFNHEKQQSLSKLFEKILSRNCSIIINSLILSEFSNACLRLDFELWKKENNKSFANFKREYFKTERALATRKLIAQTIKNQILKVSDRYPDSFNAINLDEVFKLYDRLDYNDSIIYNECRIKNWILVSDDNDFNNLSEVKILKP